MERRQILKATATVLAGAGFTSMANEASARRKPPDSSTMRAPFPYLQTAERATLFYKDWGRGEPGRAELPKVSVPTLVVHGDADHTCNIDTTGRRVAQLIPGAQLKVYAGASHGLFIPHVDAFNRELLTFSKESG
jgi:pimeloyl-ACP methyl ester carboxylesterase